MRCDGKVVLEVKEILDYYQINHNKWNELRGNFYDTHSQEQAEHQRELTYLITPRENK